MSLIVGMDPGLHGALALYSAVTRTIIVAWEMPTLVLSKTKVRGSGKKTEIDWVAYCNILAEIRATYPSLLVVERVHAMPAKAGGKAVQGISSTFKFGETFGGQRELARHILGCRIEMAEPAVWKRAMKVGTTDDDIYRRAASIFPEAERYFRGPRGGVKDGICEASLIAGYGHKLLDADRG
jgi:hypothetical protein